MWDPKRHAGPSTQPDSGRVEGEGSDLNRHPTPFLLLVVFLSIPMGAMETPLGMTGGNGKGRSSFNGGRIRDPIQGGKGVRTEHEAVPHPTDAPGGSYIGGPSTNGNAGWKGIFLDVYTWWIPSEGIPRGDALRYQTNRNGDGNIPSFSRDGHGDSNLPDRPSEPNPLEEGTHTSNHACVPHATWMPSIPSFHHPTRNSHGRKIPLCPRPSPFFPPPSTNRRSNPSTTPHTARRAPTTTRDSERNNVHASREIRRRRKRNRFRGSATR